MNALKRNGFWLVCGILLAAFVGAYAWILLSVRGDASERVTQLGVNVNEIQNYPPKELHSPKQTEALRKRATDLQKELDACHDLLRGPQRWAGGFWTAEKQASFVETKDLFNTEYHDKVLEIRGAYQGILQGANTLDIPSGDLPDVSSADSIRLSAKKLILLGQILEILKNSKVVQVRSLSFQPRTAAASGGVVAAAVAGEAWSLPTRPPLQEKDRCTSYPFWVVADLDINDLPVLLDALRASSYNVVLEGIHLEKIPDIEHEALLDNPGVVAIRHNEILRVTLVAEAFEFLFPSATPPAKVTP